MVSKSYSAPSLLPWSQSFKNKDGAKSKCQDESSIGQCSYQVFRICKERCKVLHVTIVQGMGITRGKIKDWLYSPDPYVTVQALGTPNGVKRTQHIKDSSDPQWGETLQFYIDPERDRLLEFVLYDLNRTVNEEIGKEIHDFYGLIPDEEHNVVVSYKNGSKIEVKLKLTVNPNPSLRFGLELCPEETKFLSERKLHIFHGLNVFLGRAKGPRNGSECPRICLMTSGGGFRAMIAYCGAYKAMSEAGIIDTVTYISALSGSSWYLSTLYSHPNFPEDKKITQTIKCEIRAAVEKYWQVHLSPPWSSKYLKKIIAKSVGGQPVSFTDFFGYLVGQQLLKKRMKARLSDQREKIQNGIAPMPLYTCLHVKSNISAMIFQEWYEFTPYEVGIPKYGVFMNTKEFASKFYMGQKVKNFPEVRLHFLYGIWGSAFTILFKRLVQEKGRNGEGEVLKMILGSSNADTNDKDPLASDGNDLQDDAEVMFCKCLKEECCCTPHKTTSLMNNSAKKKQGYGDEMKANREEILFTYDDLPEEEEGEYDTEEDNLEDIQDNMDDRDPETGYLTSGTIPIPSNSSVTSYGTPPTCCQQYVGSLPNELEEATQLDDLKENDLPNTLLDDNFNENIVQIQNTPKWRRKFNEKCKTVISIPKVRVPTTKKSQDVGATPPVSPRMPLNNTDSFFQFPRWGKSEKLSPAAPDVGIKAGGVHDRSRWDKVLERALTTNVLDSRAFRAGVILNPLRGLTAVENVSSSPINREIPSPVRPTDKIDCDFKGYRESMKTDDKKIYLVDSGLSFNLPFPLVLRPQRGIELYITFDFSSRKSDSTPPFRELLLAEKWAELHNLPFPPIKECVKQYIKSDEHVREIYIFKDPVKPPSEVPVIIFFPLVNHNFRHYKAPGVKRETDEEKAFGDFSLFDGTNDFAIWRFVYPNLSFDRLTKMMEFNVANNLDVIKTEMEEIIQRKRFQRNHVKT